MVKRKIPIIPKLNFIKKENQYYFFKSNKGLIINNMNDERCEIENIEIKISNTINVSFNIDIENYHELFFEKTNGNYKKSIFLSPYTIICTSGNYEITLSKCYEEKSNLNCDETHLELNASEITLIKNGEKINDGENINVWCILESNYILQNGVREFNPPQLKKIYLKSKYTYDLTFNCDNEEKENVSKISHDQQNSFNQLLDQSSFLFYKTNNLNEIPLEINNIKNLLRLFDPILNPIQMTICSDGNEKLTIKIMSDENKKSCNSIFANTSYNFYEFINSTYDNYVALKDSNIDIDLLLYYYVLLKNEDYINIKIALCSIIIEIIKNYNLKQEDYEMQFIDKIKELFPKLKLDCMKLFKFLQPELYTIFDDVTNKKLNNHYYNSHISLVCRYFRKNYIPSLIEVYRNTTIHSGDFKLDKSKLNDWIDRKWKPIVKDELPHSETLIEEVADYIKNNTQQTTSIDDLSTQTQFFECLIDIIMLTLFDVKCELGTYPHFLNIIEKSREYPLTTELIEKFKIKY